MAAGSVLIAVTAGSGSLVAATVALMAAGTANAPTLITGNALVRLVVPAPNLTEAYTWLGVSVFVGIAAGTAAAGLLVDHHGAGAALWASAVAGALVAVLPVAGRRFLVTR
jgi:predicted MFS family arabinose efflux permease